MATNSENVTQDRAGIDGGGPLGCHRMRVSRRRAGIAGKKIYANREIGSVLPTRYMRMQGQSQDNPTLRNAAEFDSKSPNIFTKD
jgi:hypothetical protein